MTESHSVDRRGFVKVVLTFLGTVMGAVVGLPAIGYLISPATKVQKSDSWIPAGPLENYQVGIPGLFSFTRTKVNGWEKTVNSFGVFVLRTDESQVKVYSNKCTHLSCRVNWKDEGGEYICPCHDGHFDLQGKVTAGPPPKALDEFEVKIEEGNILIHLMEG